jgi:hypothetical protein
LFSCSSPCSLAINLSDVKQEFLEICIKKLLPCFLERAKTVLLASATFLLLVQGDKKRKLSLAWKPSYGF